MRLSDEGRVIGFLEKPQTDEQIDTVAMAPSWIDAQGLESQGRDCLASMGIYLFRTSLLLDVLRNTMHEDFGKQVFPSLIEPRFVQVHLFDGYWEDIGTIRAFYDANLALAGENPPFDLGLPEAPIYTQPRFLPPSRCSDARVSGSFVAEGCYLGRDVVIENSIIGQRCIVGDGVTVRNSVVMGADYYETDAQLHANQTMGRPAVGIGSESVIENAIIDKNCRIGQNVKVINREGIHDTEAPQRFVDQNGYLVSDDVTVVVKDGVLEDGREI
jgi:glucose-1-phosphate adenylyltransferase